MTTDKPSLRNQLVDALRYASAATTGSWDDAAFEDIAAAMERRLDRQSVTPRYAVIPVMDVPTLAKALDALTVDTLMTLLGGDYLALAYAIADAYARVASKADDDA